MSQVRRYFVLSVAVLAIVACSSQRAPAPEPAIPSGAVGVVVVEVADSIRTDKRTRFDAEDGTARLRQAIETALAKEGKIVAQSSRVLRVEVVKFRLRSSAAVFSGGIMTGGDVLDVNVEVREGDRVERQFVTGAGMIGTGFSVSQRNRFEKVIRRAAERVAEQL